MRRARLGALIVFAALLIVVAAFAVPRAREAPPREKPTLLLLTSLPLMFGEDFSLDDGGSPALTALQSRFRVVPISVTDRADLGKGRLLFMAHSFAQTAENLVALDDWVRRGGRVLILADPMLEWPSKRPLGDPLRPAPIFMDTGLLAHWGLRLEAPEQRGVQWRKLAGRDVLANSPGSLAGTCDIAGDAFVAHCRIGKGRATVIADADLLDTGDLGSDAAENLDALVDEIAKLDRD